MTIAGMRVGVGMGGVLTLAAVIGAGKANEGPAMTLRTPGIC